MEMSRSNRARSRLMAGRSSGAAHGPQDSAPAAEGDDEDVSVGGPGDHRRHLSLVGRIDDRVRRVGDDAGPARTRSR